MTITAPAPVPVGAQPRPAVTRGWQQQAACRATPTGVDLVQLTASRQAQAEARGDGLYPVLVGRRVVRRPWGVDVAAARRVCAGCPVLSTCRLIALSGVTVAGFAGGLTEQQRQAWRARRGVNVQPLTAESYVPTDHLTAAWVTERTEAEQQTGQGMSRATFEAIVELGRAGLTAAQIAARLDVDERRVDYARQVLAGSKPLPAHWRPARAVTS